MLFTVMLAVVLRKAVINVSVERRPSAALLSISDKTSNNIFIRAADIQSLTRHLREETSHLRGKLHVIHTVRRIVIAGVKGVLVCLAGLVWRNTQVEPVSVRHRETEGKKDSQTAGAELYPAKKKK